MQLIRPGVTNLFAAALSVTAG